MNHSFDDAWCKVQESKCWCAKILNKDCRWWRGSLFHCRLPLPIPPRHPPSHIPSPSLPLHWWSPIPCFCSPQPLICFSCSAKRMDCYDRMKLYFANRPWRSALNLIIFLLALEFFFFFAVVNPVSIFFNLTSTFYASWSPFVRLSLCRLCPRALPPPTRRLVTSWISPSDVTSSSGGK